MIRFADGDYVLVKHGQSEYPAVVSHVDNIMFEKFIVFTLCIIAPGPWETFSIW